MKYHVSVSSPLSKTFRAASVCGKFDYTPGDTTTFSFEAELPTDRDDWQVGIIVGPSGSGKSLLARQAFSDQQIISGFEWNGAAIVDDFPKELSVEDITRALTSVGLSSVPTWLLPYGALSNGQRFRADLARALASSEYVVYDEFTSVVDRDVARTASYAVSKAIRRVPGKRFVAVTCHSDITEWLEPDWVYDTAAGELRWGRLRRPSIQLRLYRGDVSSWPLFRRHHYMSHDIHRAAKVTLAYMQIGESPERLVGFSSHLSMAGHKGIWQGHRHVVLPDFQGSGIGSRMIEAACERLQQEKACRIFGVTGSPTVNAHRAKSLAWKLSRAASRTAQDMGKRSGIKRASNRLTCSWEYIPVAARAQASQASDAAQ